METQDVTQEVDKESFTARGTLIKAERKGTNTLILYKHKPVKRFDGKTGTLTLVYRWHKNDQVEVYCVMGEEDTIWKPKELGDYEHKSLFDLVNLF